jgi:hypothetical protein
MDIFTLANSGSISSLSSKLDGQIAFQERWNKWAVHRIETLMEEVKRLQQEVEQLKAVKQ